MAATDPSTSPSASQPLQPRVTEATLPASTGLDQWSALQIARQMNHEDGVVVAAVEAELPQVAAAIDGIVNGLRRGGRLLYVGAGTSGRLGVLDASECPPTFGTDPDLVVGVIAGGPPALTRSQEGAEDQREVAVADLESLHLAATDTVVGISAGGTTPYVLAAVEYAQKLGCLTIGFSCNGGSPLQQAAAIDITPQVGAEVLAGSTRLKAGTATKMVLNMLSTGAMVRLGKTHGNLMSHLQPANDKLKKRALQIIQQVTSLSAEDADALLVRADHNVAEAIALHASSSPRVLHITSHAALQEAEASGFVTSPSLESEGFIHCSTAAQLPTTLGRHFAAHSDVVVLHLDSASLAATLRWEDTSGHGEFPHVYGRIPMTSVLSAHSIHKGSDGVFPIPDALCPPDA